MPYITLSEQVKKLHNPQRSDAFVKLLRSAVREGEVMAADLPARFDLPKQYARRGENEKYTRKVRDMVIDATPKFEAWFDQANVKLTPARAGGRIKVSLESVEAGLVDFKVLAAETRKKMGASFSKGQTLGKSRTNQKKAAPKKTAGRK